MVKVFPTLFSPSIENFASPLSTKAGIDNSSVILIFLGTEPPHPLPVYEFRPSKEEIYLPSSALI